MWDPAILTSRPMSEVSDVLGGVSTVPAGQNDPIQDGPRLTPAPRVRLPFEGEGQRRQPAGDRRRAGNRTGVVTGKSVGPRTAVDESVVVGDRDSMMADRVVVTVAEPTITVEPSVATSTRSSTPGSVVRLPFRHGSVLTPQAQRRTRRGSNLRRRLVLIDVVMATIGWSWGILAPTIWSARTEGLRLELLLVVAAVAGQIAALATQHLYLGRVASVREIELTGLLRAVLPAAAIAFIAQSLLGSSAQPAQVIVGALLALPLLIIGRGIYSAWLRQSRGRGRFQRPVILVGANEEAQSIARLVSVHADLGYEIIGICGDHTDYLRLGFDEPWLGESEYVVNVVDGVSAEGVIVAASALQSDALNGLIRSLLRNGDLHVQVSTGLRGIDHRRLRAVPLSHEPLFYLEQATLSPAQRMIKRTVDLVVSMILVLLAAPVMIVTAIAIKVHDGGPVLFRQARIGRNGQTFTVFKFRTMTPDAESRLGDVKALVGNERDGVLFKLARDPRRTRVGRVVEGLSIDELPQLFNVLQGTMSLVGPRPALPHEVERFDDELLTRFFVPPGITGLWQVEARDNPSFAAYRRLDLFYVENWSLSLDLVILIETASAVICRPIKRFGRSRSRAAT